MDLAGRVLVPSRSSTRDDDSQAQGHSSTLGEPLLALKGPLNQARTATATAPSTLGTPTAANANPPTQLARLARLPAHFCQFHQLTNQPPPPPAATKSANLQPLLRPPPTTTTTATTKQQPAAGFPRTLFSPSSLVASHPLDTSSRPHSRLQQSASVLPGWTLSCGWLRLYALIHFSFLSCLSAVACIVKDDPSVSHSASIRCFRSKSTLLTSLCDPRRRQTPLYPTKSAE